MKWWSVLKHYDKRKKSFFWHESHIFVLRKIYFKQMKIIAVYTQLKHLRVYNELTIDQLPVGLIAQLVRALHRYRRGHGFDSRSGLNFFQALFLNCLSWVYTAMIFICLKCIFRSTNIWLSCILITNCSILSKGKKM